MTLVFQDTELEARYRTSMHRQTLPAVRFGVVLAIVLYALFGVIDWWLAREQLAAIWVARTAVLVSSAAIFAWSFRPGFSRFREFVISAYSVLLSLGLIAICAVAPLEVANQYYVGHLLIILATFTLFGPRFPNAVLASVSILAAFVIYEYWRENVPYSDFIVHSTFVFSAVIVAGVGGYIAEMQRRLAFYRSCVIEYDRARNAHSALHDPLTGLPNRRLFMEKLAHAVARDQRFHSHCAVLFMDIDAFKPINDDYGHVFGDRLLMCVAQRLHECVRATDTVARFGGDEFVVLLEDVSSGDDVEMLVGRIKTAFQANCEVDGVGVPATLSIGRAVHPGNGDTPDALLEYADQAMYRVKRQHGRR